MTGHLSFFFPLQARSGRLLRRLLPPESQLRSYCPAHPAGPDLLFRPARQWPMEYSGAPSAPTPECEK